jgi:hypothetical protein
MQYYPPEEKYRCSVKGILVWMSVDSITLHSSPFVVYRASSAVMGTQWVLRYFLMISCVIRELKSHLINQAVLLWSGYILLYVPWIWWPYENITWYVSCTVKHNLSKQQIPGCKLFFCVWVSTPSRCSLHTMVWHFKRVSARLISRQMAVPCTSSQNLVSRLIVDIWMSTWASIHDNISHFQSYHTVYSLHIIVSIEMRWK